MAGLRDYSGQEPPHPSHLEGDIVQRISSGHLVSVHRVQPHLTSHQTSEGSWSETCILGIPPPKQPGVQSIGMPEAKVPNTFCQFPLKVHFLQTRTFSYISQHKDWDQEINCRCNTNIWFMVYMWILPVLPRMQFVGIYVLNSESNSELHFCIYLWCFVISSVQNCFLAPPHPSQPWDF